MRQKNDGRGRLGGRTAGTPNKITGTLKEWLNNLLDENREQIEKDLKLLSPKDRLIMLEKLLQYVIPKQKTELEITNIQSTENKDDDLFDLSCVPNDLLFELADRILDARYNKIQEETQKKIK